VKLPPTSIGSAAIGAGSARFLVAWDEYGGPKTAGDVHGLQVTTAAQVFPLFTVAQAATAQRGVALASGATGYLAVWEDQRGGRDGGTIYASRLTAAGGIPDRGGFPLSAPGDFGDEQPAVAWNGVSYLVAWFHDRGAVFDVHAVRVSATGQLLDALPVEVASGIRDPVGLAVSWSGTRYLVAWAGKPAPVGTSDLLGRLLDAGAQPVGGVFPIAASAAGEFYPAAASAGGAFIVVWLDASTGSVRRARVSTEGGVSPLGAIAAIPTRASFLSIAAGGPGFLVAAAGSAPTPGGGLYLARLGPTGEALDTAALVLRPSAVAVQWPTAIRTAGQFVVLWPEGGSAYAARVTDSGEVVDAPPIAIGPVGGAGWATSRGPAHLITAAPSPSGQVAAVYQRQETGLRYGDASRLFARFLDGLGG
jgi:hypothetical protein